MIEYRLVKDPVAAVVARDISEPFASIAFIGAEGYDISISGERYVGEREGGGGAYCPIAG